eukprot:TRINITY_DN70201_c0_g1_i1.p1 TRINITY_DN70201_c0_g1~~TRINITY_DN70201_c0_g1_i1.p1  ORF type:complete len:505 (+),score=64.17 TRINITY_DN70201_c0_g1_i1:22-1536(+)
MATEIPEYVVAGSSFPRALAAGHLFPYLDSLTDRTQPTVRLASPEDIEQALAATGVPLHIPDGAAPRTDMAPLLATCEQILRFAVRTGHPHFLNQLYAHSDPVAISGEWLSAVASTDVSGFDDAPPQALIEAAVVRKFGRCVGGEYAANSGRGCEGLFVPGGSIANTYALLLARYKADPEVRNRGVFGAPRLVAFTSAQSHYSYVKAMMLLGLGRENLVAVPCDACGNMLVDRLREAVSEAIKAGGIPFFVGATAGTTVTGGFDPIPALRAVCEAEKMWLHVDASWGGACLLSRCRYLLDGIEKADSIVWNFHKVMSVPVQASCFITRHVGLLQECNGLEAEEEHGQTDLHFGKISLHDGRRADAIKVWLTWHACGDVGWKRRMDHSADLAEYFERRVRELPNFQMVVPRVWINVCFWYLPPSITREHPEFDFETASDELKGRLGTVAPKIKARMQQLGLPLVGYQPLGGLPNFFRVVFPGAGVNVPGDVDFVLESIHAQGKDL